MAWEHDMARHFKARDNKPYMVYFTGKVQSPKKVADQYIGPLKVSAFDGQVILEADRLKTLAHLYRVYYPQEIALLGNPFGGEAGSQSILILGVIKDAV